MGIGIRDSGFGKAGSMKLAGNRQSVRALLLPNPESRFATPGSAGSRL